MSKKGFNDFAESIGKQLHDQGFNCAECTLLAIQEWMNWDYNSVPRIATGFGGGIGRSGNLCGAASGIVMSLGLAYGRGCGEDKEAQTLAYRLARVFLNQFEAEFGTVICQGISRVNFDDAEDVSRWLAEGGRDRCTQVIVKAIQLAGPFFTP